MKVFSTHSDIKQLQMVELSVDSNQQFSIVIELMSSNLRELIVSRLRTRFPASMEKEKGLFDLRESSFIITKFALGMAFLHSKEVVHRDLKPANVCRASTNTAS